MAIKYRTKEDALKAVKAAGYLLTEVSPELCDDEEVVVTAIKNQARIYNVSFRLQNSPEIVKLYAENFNAPDNDFARVLYSVILSPNIYGKEYTRYYLDNNIFQIEAKLRVPELVSIVSKYNSMDDNQLKEEAKLEKFNEIVKLREEYCKSLSPNTYEFKGIKCFPFAHKMIHNRAINKPFSEIKAIIEMEIKRCEMEKEAFLSTTKGGSFPERYVSSFLRILGIEFNREMVFSWSEGTGAKGHKRYDFFLPDFNTIIEVHGAQHYQGGFEFCGGRTLAEEQANDKYKEKLARENGISKYIVINASTSDPEYLRKSICVNKEFSKYFDASNVDWAEVRRGTVLDTQSAPTPVHDIRLSHLRGWLDVITESLIKSDYLPPPDHRNETDNKPYTKELEANLKKAVPSSSGLYPHEILLLNDAVKFYSTSQTEFPGKWFYGHGIADVLYYLAKLKDQGYLATGNIRKTLEMQTVPDLKRFLVKYCIETLGNKEDLVIRILNEMPTEAIEKYFNEKYYALTEKGEKELDENQYLFEPFNDRDTIWSLNRRNAKKLKNGTNTSKRTDILRSAWPAKKYNRSKWINTAELARKSEEYKKEIELYIDVMYHDISGFDDISDLRIQWIQKNLQFYFPYSTTAHRVAPGLANRVQLSVKRAVVFSGQMTEMIKKVISEHELEWHIFTKEEAALIIDAEINGDPHKASEIYEIAYSRIRKYGIKSYNRI